MFIYTTCRDCGGLLHVTDNETVHPHCRLRPIKVEALTQRWVKAVQSGDTLTEDKLHTEIDDIDTATPRMLDAALKYASWKWPVFPLIPHDKKPLIAGGNGLHDATTNVEQITNWWTQHPQANIGLPTGHAFDVIDIDVPKGMYSYIELLCDEDPKTGTGLIPDIHGQVATSSGGIHFYIKPTGDGNTVNIAPGIDYRGRGGYAVAPPSTIGRRGRTWTWTVHPSPVITGSGDTYGQ